MTLPAVEAGALVVTFMDNCARGILMGGSISQCQQQSRLDALHYWLRSIKGGQFRLVNFASHFIRVQIFQIDFPLILYL